MPTSVECRKLTFHPQKTFFSNNVDNCLGRVTVILLLNFALDIHIRICTQYPKHSGKKCSTGTLVAVCLCELIDMIF